MVAAKGQGGAGAGGGKKANNTFVNPVSRKERIAVGIESSAKKKFLRPGGPGTGKKNTSNTLSWREKQ